MSGACSLSWSIPVQVCNLATRINWPGISDLGEFQVSKSKNNLLRVNSSIKKTTFSVAICCNVQ